MRRGPLFKMSPDSCEETKENEFPLWTESIQNMMLYYSLVKFPAWKSEMLSGWTSNNVSLSSFHKPSLIWNRTSA